MMTLSVLVPVYNEEHLVATSLARLEILGTSPHLSRIQIVVVDDCSRDGTAQVLERFKQERELAIPSLASEAGGGLGQRLGRMGGRIEWLFLRHEKNAGKGKAIQTALAQADGEISIIHDADLEYHPKDILRIVEVFAEEGADAVFGSRFAGGASRRVLFFRHELGNRLLTFLTNLATNLNLTDMETCYKAVRTNLLKSIPIVSNDFRLEPELTIKLAKREARVFEVPISYSGRSYQEGKKINWKDGVKALAAITRFSLSRDIYARDEYGSHVAGRRRPAQVSSWLADIIRPFCGARVLEIGSGVGDITLRLIPRKRYVATDVNPLHLHALGALGANRPYLDAQYCDVEDLASFPRAEGGFDSVVAIDVIEQAERDREALANIRSVLAPGGRAIVLVPQGENLFGSLDEALGNKRRYSKASLRRLCADAGFAVRELIPFNRHGTPAWWLSKLLKRHSLALFQSFIPSFLFPLFRRLDRFLPFAPLSLLAVLEPVSDGAAGCEVTEPVRARLAPFTMVDRGDHDAAISAEDSTASK